MQRNERHLARRFVVTLVLTLGCRHAPSVSSSPGLTPAAMPAPALVGFAHDSSGRAVAGAAVAIIALDSAPVEPAALVHSGSDGRFVIANLRSTSYSITATAPGLVGGYDEDVKTEIGRTAQVDMILARDGVTYSGK